METLGALGAVLLYGAVHSAAASTAWKARVTALVGERALLGLYRVSYSIVSVVTLLPILALLAARPGTTVWALDGTVADLLRVTRAMTLAGVFAALLQVDALRFLGIREAVAFSRGRPLPLPDERLVVRGVYRLVRHPLYLFGLIALWSSPVMTESVLGFTIGVTLYVIFGSLLEEKRMSTTFGPEYDEYRKAVPWLIPFHRTQTWRRFKSRSGSISHHGGESKPTRERKP